MNEEKYAIIEDLQRQIIQHQTDLSSSVSDIGDWKIIKIQEARLQGRPDPYDADELIRLRQDRRDAINRLEREIAELERE